MDLGVFYDIELALAEGDMSTGWIYGVSGVHPWFMAILEDRAQEVWGGDNTRLICSSLMPAGKATAADGGYRPSGRWQCELLRPLRLGAARRPGRGRRRTPPHGRIFWCRGRTTRPSTPGRSPARRAPAAGTSSSTTCSCPATGR